MSDVSSTPGGLSDQDPMPFGTHKGTPMEDVPASYLHWLWTEGLESDHKSKVANYIRENLASLKQEYPNGVW